MDFWKTEGCKGQMGCVLHSSNRRLLCTRVWYIIWNKRICLPQIYPLYILRMDHCKMLCIGCGLSIFLLFFSVDSHCSDSCSRGCSDTVQGAGNHCRRHLLCPWSVCCTRGKALIHGHSFFLLVMHATSKHCWLDRVLLNHKSQIVLNKMDFKMFYIKKNLNRS